MKILIICIIGTGGLCWIANTQDVSNGEARPASDTMKVAKRDTLLDKLSRAVAKIESRNNPKARRFEPHVFTRFTGEIAASFDEAKKIDWRAAVKSTSIGKYQLLGCNYRKAGFKRIEDLYHASSAEQDSAFVRFIRSQGLERVVRERKWTVFARCYNGKGYRRNNYHNKLIAEMR